MEVSKATETPFSLPSSSSSLFLPFSSSSLAQVPSAPPDGPASTTVIDNPARFPVTLADQTELSPLSPSSQEVDAVPAEAEWPPLPDVRGDAKQCQAAARLLAPLSMEASFPANITDKYFNYKIFAEPVLAIESGETYEKEVIMEWLKDHDYDPSQPHTKVSNKSNLPVNQNVKRAIEEFLQRSEWVRDSAHLYLPQAWVTALESASVTGNIEQIKRLCGLDRRLISWQINDFDIKNAGWSGKRAIHLMCAQGTVKSVDTLLQLAEKRAAGLGLLLLLQPDSQGKLPIHHAILNSQAPQMAPYVAARLSMALVQLKPLAIPAPDQRIDDAREITALHLAVISHNPKPLMALLASSPPLDSRDHLGNTALHLAVQTESLAAMGLLIRAGATFDIENNQGKTAYTLALESDNPRVTSGFDQLMRELEQRLASEGPLGLRLLAQLRKNAHLQVKHTWQRQKITVLEGQVQAQQQQLTSARGSLNRLEQKEKYVREHHSELNIFSCPDLITSSAQLRRLVIEELPKNPLAEKMHFSYLPPEDSKQGSSTKRTMGKKTKEPSAVLLPDGRVLAASMQDSSYVIWNVKEGKGFNKCWGSYGRFVLAVGHDSLVTINIQKLPEKNYQLDQWDTSSFERIPRFTYKTYKPVAALVLPNQDIIVSAIKNDGSRDPDPNLERWGKIIWDTSFVNRVGVLAQVDSERILCGNDRGVLYILNSHNGKDMSILSGPAHKGPVTALVVLDQGRKAISGGADGYLKIWNIVTRRCEFSIKAHFIWFVGSQINSLVILNDQLLASASNDKTVKVWKMDRKTDGIELECVATLPHHCAVTTVMASADGEVISQTEDGLLHFRQNSRPLKLDLQFCPAFTHVTVQQSASQVTIKLIAPAKPALEECVEALRLLYLEEPLRLTMPDEQTLIIGGIKSVELSHELLELIQVFAGQKPAPSRLVSFSGAYSQSLLPPPAEHKLEEKKEEKRVKFSEALPGAGGDDIGLQIMPQRADTQEQENVAVKKEI